MPDEMNKDEIRIRQILANVQDYVLARQFSVASAGEATERLADALLKKGSIEKVGVEDKRTLIKIRTSDNAHSFIIWSYDWREIPKLCKKAKEELYNQLLILADKVKKEKKEKE